MPIKIGGFRGEKESNPDFFSFRKLEDYRRLREVFDACGYSDAGVLEALDLKVFPSLRTTDLPILMRRTERERPIDTLIRLFLMAVPVSATAARHAFHGMDLSACEAAGVIGENDGNVFSRLKILPFKGFLIASDHHRVLHAKDPSGFVMGIGASSLTLSNLTIRRPVGATLDLGTGCGIQALLAAGHSQRVVATDKNPRAARMAAFNARLNGLSHVQCLIGDLFEAFGREKFDLVVTNPPFVVSPETRYIYRDGGMAGDQICRRIVREVPRFLRPGGFCQILCNWVETAEAPWQERIAEWFDGTGCDGWVIRSESRDPATYAGTWIRHTEPGIDSAEFARKFDTWMDYYKTRRIIGMSAGLITLRRMDRVAPHFRAEEAPDKMIGPCGEDIWAGFYLQDYLCTVQSDSHLLDQKLRISSRLRLVREAQPGEGGWVETSLELQQTEGLAYRGNMDSLIAHLMAGCDGRRPLGALVAELAGEIGETIEAITAPVCESVRKLIGRGFLLPEADPPGL